MFLVWKVFFFSSYQEATNKSIVVESPPSSPLTFEQPHHHPSVKNQEEVGCDHVNCEEFQINPSKNARLVVHKGLNKRTMLREYAGHTSRAPWTF